VDFLLNSPFAQAAMGAGLATLCGLRAFLPLALFGLFARYNLLSAPDLQGTGFAFLTNPWVIGILFALAAFEIVADKLPALGGAQDFIAIPLRMAAGAAVFGASLASEGAVAIVVGIMAGFWACLKVWWTDFKAASVC
jgi:uncharacterized membrane protein